MARMTDKDWDHPEAGDARFRAKEAAETVLGHFFSDHTDAMARAREAAVDALTKAILIKERDFIKAVTKAAQISD